MELPGSVRKCFSQKKALLIFRETETAKGSLIFQETKLSRVSN